MNLPRSFPTYLVTSVLATYPDPFSPTWWHQSSKRTQILSRLPGDISPRNLPRPYTYDMRAYMQNILYACACIHIQPCNHGCMIFIIIACIHAINCFGVARKYHIYSCVYIYQSIYIARYGVIRYSAHFACRQGKRGELSFFLVRLYRALAEIV
jgi:hypothetical protein